MENRPDKEQEQILLEKSLREFILKLRDIIHNMAWNSEGGLLGNKPPKGIVKLRESLPMDKDVEQMGLKDLKNLRAKLRGITLNREEKSMKTRSEKTDDLYAAVSGSSYGPRDTQLAFHQSKDVDNKWDIKKLKELEEKLTPVISSGKTMKHSSNNDL